MQILEAPTEAVKKGITATAIAAKESLLHGGGSATTQEKDIQQIAEKAIDTGVNVVGGVVTAPFRFVSWRTKRKYEKFEKAKGKAVKANTKLAYKKYRFESTAQSRPTKKCEARKQSSIKSFAKKAVYERLPQRTEKE